MLDELHRMAEQIAAALSSVAEDRSSPRNYDYRLARAQAGSLADILRGLSAANHPGSTP